MAPVFRWLKNKLLSIPGSYGSVVNKQIDVYLELRKDRSGATESEMLNELLASRIRTYTMMPHQYSPEEAEAYYKPLFENDEKTLHSVILDIVMYEFIVSRQDWTTKHSTQRERLAFASGVDEYITCQIEQRVAHK